MKQLLKSVLHALYHTFKYEPGMNIGTCRVSNINRDDLRMMIAIHDRLVDEELTGGKPDLSIYSKDFQEAIQYVRENKGWTDAEDDMALEVVNRKESIPYKILDSISDLMEEYGDDNDLGEGWWLDEADAEEIFWLLK